MNDHKSLRALGLSYSFIIGIMGIAGCGGNSGVPRFPVTGSLNVNGAPATGAIIGLHPVDGDFDDRGSRPSGKVKEDGSFTISCYGVSDGAPVGNYNVSIFWPQYPERDDPGDDRLRGKYADPKSSKLRISVSEGENTLAPISLDKVKVLKGS